MHILLGYSYTSHTTGFYLQRSFEKKYKVTYVGPSAGVMPGFPLNLDLNSLASALPIKPDLFLFIDTHTSYFPCGLEKLSFPTAAYLIDVHIDLKLRLKQAQFFDFIFVAQKDYIPAFKKACPNTHIEWLPLACDPSVHYKQNLEKIYDIGFVGQVARGHERRKERLEKLAQRYYINDYNRYYNPCEMAKIYNQSHIVFNGAFNNDLNMRVFEAMSCGTMLLTEKIGNGQDELFSNKKDFVTYQNDQELLEMAEYYLTHYDEREKIALSGHKLVLAKHTYDHRVDTIMSSIFGNQNFYSESIIRRSAEAEISKKYIIIYSSLRLVDAVIDEMVKIKKSSGLNIKSFYFLIISILRRIKHDIFSS